jgi:hypothetical protein
MAYSEITTKIQNPASTGKGRKMASRKMREKQLKSRRNPPKGRGRVISGYGSTVMNFAAPRKRRKNPGGGHKIVINSARKRRKNPAPAIISWAAGNPAKRSNKSMAKHKKKKRATAKRSNPAGSRRRTARKNVSYRRRNPAGLGSPVDWISGGAGVLVGLIGSRSIPQMLMAGSNTGATGYAMNAISAIGLGFLAHYVFPRKPMIAAAVVTGGFAGLIDRVLSDNTPFGAQLALSGVGDYGLGLYQKSNYPYPARVQGARGPASSMFTWGDGSQTSVTLATQGADSTSAC